MYYMGFSEIELFFWIIESNRSLFIFIIELPARQFASNSITDRVSHLSMWKYGVWIFNWRVWDLMTKIWNHNRSVFVDNF